MNKLMFAIKSFYYHIKRWIYTEYYTVIDYYTQEELGIVEDDMQTLIKFACHYFKEHPGSFRVVEITDDTIYVERMYE